VEGSGHGVIEGPVLACAWRDWVNHRQQQVR